MDEIFNFIRSTIDDRQQNFDPGLWPPHCKKGFEDNPYDYYPWVHLAEDRKTEFRALLMTCLDNSPRYSSYEYNEPKLLTFNIK